MSENQYQDQPDTTTRRFQAAYKRLLVIAEQLQGEGKGWSPADCLAATSRLVNAGVIAAVIDFRLMQIEATIDAKEDD